MEKNREKLLRSQILESVKEYYEEVHRTEPDFKPGDRVPTGGRSYDHTELTNLVSASLDFWLTAGPWTEKFERGLCTLLGVKFCDIVNSGSSANMLAFMALTAPEHGARRIVPGDEVITVAAGFPTTVTPIVQFGAVPVFVDVDIPTYNIAPSKLENALSTRTKAVFCAHTLGNPFDIERVRDFCDRHNLWLVEDTCDALSSKYSYRSEMKYAGTVGDIATCSFYPAHHITMGEGGAILTNNPLLNRIMVSMRDWGRDCWCQTGTDNTCKNRFSGQFGQLPRGYDHKYVYSRFGYNLKATDLQAAIGCAQLEKLEDFAKVRQNNWRVLHDGLQEFQETLILPEPLEGSQPSWFGFPITIRDSAPFTRMDLTGFLEKHNIQTRPLFAGNIIKHPCFDEIRSNQGAAFRVAGSLENTDLIMNNTFWIGVCPVCTTSHLEHAVEIFSKYIKQ